ncbi:malto-oligosyltrehalose synthase [Cytophagaceae bacterium ABcell3]|nr:malto-oligosyltrehalose synthase [Cytophagaceae bacterium ABcell3]
MINPVSTYRLQLHKGFTLADLDHIIPYLKSLGVKTVYASPIFQATPGSTHGYDGVNPHLINPEIGSEEILKQISQKLKENDILWLQDIVPNHMAFHPDNIWLWDVLEKGRRSIYAEYFDIAWNSHVYNGKLMVPFLGSPLEDLLRNGEIKLDYHDTRLIFRYYDNTYPLQPASYLNVLRGENTPEEVKNLLNKIPLPDQNEDKTGYQGQWDEIRQQLSTLLNQEHIRDWFNDTIYAISSSPEYLKEIADQQIYQLSHWQETDHQINYRRFFTINGLICLNIHKKEVFEDYHKQIKKLIDEGVIQGLRIDHIDGLYDPTTYLQQLRKLSGENLYIVVEKILEPRENLPEHWKIQGNTGYDFLTLVNNLLTRRKSKERLTEFYRKLTDDDTPVHSQVLEKKANILYNNMAGELDNLSKLFFDLDLQKDHDIPYEDLKKAIGAVLIHCPVYRYYGHAMPLDKEEQNALKQVFKEINKKENDLSEPVNALEGVLIKAPEHGDAEFNRRALQFYQRLMQFSGPLMAKGVEDTLMYTYNRFIGLNEVGGSPELFGISPEEFHQHMQERLLKMPLSMNATATHDTKRGEDVSARLNALSDIPGRWLKMVKKWQKLNQEAKQNGPDTNDEYFIYQTLVGAYPMPGQDEDNFKQRFKKYLVKALREGKLNSNWTQPNEAYEAAVTSFAEKLLEPENAFMKSFKKFHEELSDFGIVNSLSKLVLKFTCPGTPDVYQGCEFWDLSMVDPDNRRPVDYKLRQDALKTFENSNELELESLWGNRYNAQIKQWLTTALLKERKQNPELFSEGEYIPLQVKGAYASHVLAFARRHKQDWLVVAIPLHIGRLCKGQKQSLDALDWKDTRVSLPPEAPDHYEQLTDAKGKKKGNIAIKDLFNKVPIGVAKLKKLEKNRDAGILMHISSLPSAFGTGDFGPEAQKFADFLARSRQKYWQILPLNPTEEGTGYSPYSSISSMAGNTLLLSPELMAEDGLIKKEKLKQFKIPTSETANFPKAEKIRKVLFKKAWKNFQKGKAPHLKPEFEAFCAKEAFWLDDFALYLAIKDAHKGKAWFQWPEALKKRDKRTLEEFAEENQEVLEKIKWFQYMFIRQWKHLKAYCNKQDIHLFGDLPFYVSYDSADVWAHPGIFSLDEEGNIKGVAGVPPDYFNANGQLWGMPVFKWEVLKQRNYDWWIQRLRKNMELYDFLRLDHFRAFADYWEVPAGEETAINGTWKDGPGKDFFEAVKKALGDLPFIAEDLGDINELVHNLRDDLKLPGMKVLQFAFGDDLPESIYIPHNYTPLYIAYTGTHDNNTTKGWFRQDAGSIERKNMEKYTGIKVTDDNVHEVLARLAYSSVAKTAILPIQDVLGLDEQARMNIPASVEKNWLWRLKKGALKPSIEKKLRNWTRTFNR